MKNKESKNNVLNTTTSKLGSKIDPKEASRLIASGKIKTSQFVAKKSREGPSKTQIDRLKKFYNTTRWLPNSAFTTYFGKPAFENYGNGNTKPVYGGLFYGNYLLSHNINPMDGPNLPDSKQVYSSAMLKSIKNNKIRKPSPPRKTPDEIRHTQEELDEIANRNPIFQLPNHFPARDIVKPNLVKSRYFCSGKNSPNQSFDNNTNEYEVFEIEDVLNNRTTKKKKKTASQMSSDFNPFNQAKPGNAKKKVQEELDQEVVQAETKKTKENLSNEEKEYLVKKQFYEKMLEEDNNNTNNEKNTHFQKKNLNSPDKEEKEIQTGEDFYKNEDTKEGNCTLCQSASFIDSKIRLKKKENPCLMEPNGIKHVVVCCVHHSKDPLTLQEKDPKNYKHLPACSLEKIVPAGKPLRYSEPIGNLFR